jgi:adenylate cyclase
LVFSGRREGRIALQNCLRLNPCDPARAVRVLELAISRYFDGSYEQAAPICRQAIRQVPNHAPSYGFLLASLGQPGREPDCEALLKIVAAGYDRYARHRPP